LKEQLRPLADRSDDFNQLRHELKQLVIDFPLLSERVNSVVLPSIEELQSFRKVVDSRLEAEIEARKSNMSQLTREIATVRTDIHAWPALFSLRISDLTTDIHRIDSTIRQIAGGDLNDINLSGLSNEIKTPQKSLSTLVKDHRHEMDNCGWEMSALHAAIRRVDADCHSQSVKSQQGFSAVKEAIGTELAGLRHLHEWGISLMTDNIAKLNLSLSGERASRESRLRQLDEAIRSIHDSVERVGVDCKGESNSLRPELTSAQGEVRNELTRMQLLLDSLRDDQIQSNLAIAELSHQFAGHFAPH
jgi:methyl-accepting chemotaxis protein